MTERILLTRRRLLELGGAGATALPLFHIGNPALAAEGDLAAQVAAAKEIVAKAAASQVPWDGPTTGPTRRRPGGRSSSSPRTSGTAARWASAKA
jgi:hypothetical protein